MADRRPLGLALLRRRIPADLMSNQVLRNLAQFVPVSLLLTGCARGPSGIAVPEWAPAVVAGRILTECDANGDRNLSAEELKKSPGLLSATSYFDRDGNGSVSENELTSKLQELYDDQAALVEINCMVTRGGVPLEGAKIEFVPESFLGESFHPAVGVTGPDGVAFPTVADEHLPAEYRGRIHGVHCGVFRVVITHPTIEIPAKYNTQTKLGRTVTRRDKGSMNIKL